MPSGDIPNPTQPVVSAVILIWITSSTTFQYNVGAGPAYAFSSCCWLAYSTPS